MCEQGSKHGAGGGLGQMQEGAYERFSQRFWTRWLRIDKNRGGRSMGSHPGVLVRCYGDPDKEQ